MKRRDRGPPHALLWPSHPQPLQNSYSYVPCMHSPIRAVCQYWQVKKFARPIYKHIILDSSSRMQQNYTYDNLVRFGSPLGAVFPTMNLDHLFEVALLINPSLWPQVPSRLEWLAWKGGTLVFLGRRGAPHAVALPPIAALTAVRSVSGFSTNQTHI